MTTPRQSIDRTIGEDTNTQHVYSVNVGPYIRFDDIKAVDAYAAERKAKRMYLSEIGLPLQCQPVAHFKGKVNKK